MYYSRFDQVLGIPTGLRGVINVRDGKVEKTKSQSDKHGVHIRSKGWGASGVFGCDGPSSCGSWFTALKNASEVHLKKQERMDAPRKHREMLGLPQEGSVQKKDIIRAYKKMCLKCHPDRGGDRDEFNRVQDAYASIMALQEVEELHQNCIIFDYEAVIEKDAKSGLGLVVKEDHALGRVVVSKIEATVKIKGMSEEGNGYIKIGDAIVGIDDDDTTEWPLSRIRGRLGPSRLSPGGTVTFVFERRDPIEPEPIVKEEPPVTPMPSTSTEGVHPSWDNTEEHTHYFHNNSKAADFAASFAPTENEESEKFDNQNSCRDSIGRRPEIGVEKELCQMEARDDEHMEEVLYEASPMSPAHRGSVKELSFVDPAVEPLHEMEELFDLLETIRSADLTAPCFDTDAHVLKELMAKEYSQNHAVADSLSQPRAEELVAQITALRKGSAIEANESYRALCRVSKLDAAPVTRNELYDQVKRDALQVENMMRRLSNT